MGDRSIALFQVIRESSTAPHGNDSRFKPAKADEATRPWTFFFNSAFYSKSLTGRWPAGTKPVNLKPYDISASNHNIVSNRDRGQDKSAYPLETLPRLETDNLATAHQNT